MKAIISIIALISALQAFGSIDMSKATSKVDFLAVGNPGLLKVRGKLAEEKNVSGNLEFKDKKVTGTLSVKLDGFDTGINLRNQHMKEKYLETAKFPEAKLTLKPISIEDKGSADFEWTGPFEGTLSLHGVDKPVSGKSTLKKNKEKWVGDFSFGFELTDFAIAVPSYLGITISKTVQVEASFQQ